MATKVCAYKNCKRNTHPLDPVESHMFLFPKNEESRKKWLNLGQVPAEMWDKELYFCSLHFEYKYWTRLKNGISLKVAILKAYAQNDAVMETEACDVAQKSGIDVANVPKVDNDFEPVPLQIGALKCIPVNNGKDGRIQKKLKLSSDNKTGKTGLKLTKRAKKVSTKASCCDEADSGASDCSFDEDLQLQASSRTLSNITSSGALFEKSPRTMNSLQHTTEQNATNISTKISSCSSTQFRHSIENERYLRSKYSEMAALSEDMNTKLLISEGKDCVPMTME